MNHAVQHTAGTAKDCVRILAHRELHRLISHDAVDRGTTIIEVVNDILCAHYNRDPSDPTKPLPSTLKVAS